MGKVYDYLTNYGKGNLYRHLDKGDQADKGEFECVYRYTHESGATDICRIAVVREEDALTLLKEWSNDIWKYELVRLIKI